jgi:DnaJ-class molecular chaperone
MGKSIPCAQCGGHGLRAVWSFGVKEPDECGDCGGSGSNWQYPRGAIAKYYSGPLIGRTPSDGTP